MAPVLDLSVKPVMWGPGKGFTKMGIAVDPKVAKGAPSLKECFTPSSRSSSPALP